MQGQQLQLVAGGQVEVAQGAQHIARGRAHQGFDQHRIGWAVEPLHPRRFKVPTVGRLLVGVALGEGGAFGQYAARQQQHEAAAQQGNDQGR